MSTESRATSTTEQQHSRERAKAGHSSAQSQIVVVDLGEPQSTDDVGDLRKGQGKLLVHVESIISDLVAAGTVGSNAQPVVIVVRENSSFPIDVDDDED